MTLDELNETLGVSVMTKADRSDPWLTGPMRDGSRHCLHSKHGSDTCLMTTDFIDWCENCKMIWCELQ